MSEGAGRISENTMKAIQGLFVFALLLIDYAETEKNFIGFVEVLDVINKTC